jgi:hypothetical protein
VSYGRVAGISDAGDVLLYLDGAIGRHAAIWDGTATTVVTPDLAANETFDAADCVMNAAGDAAVLVHDDAGGCRLFYVAAADRTTHQTRTFTGTGGGTRPVYHLQLGPNGIASFETAAGEVRVANFAVAESRTFNGNRAFLNRSGQLVFTATGNIWYWDAQVWTGEPAAVPTSIQSSTGGPDIAGYNDEGALLVLTTLNSDRTLSILAPVVPGTTSVTLKPIRKKLRLTVGTRIRDRLVETFISGNAPDGRIRYIRPRKLPTKMRFRVTEGILSGIPRREQKLTLSIAASYWSEGVQRESPPVKVRVVIREPASLQTR